MPPLAPPDVESEYAVPTVAVRPDDGAVNDGDPLTGSDTFTVVSYVWNSVA